MELARQAEENKRLRKSLLAQSEKFLSLRQSTNTTNTAITALPDHRGTPVRLKTRLIYERHLCFLFLFLLIIKGSAPQSSLQYSKVQPSRSARFNTGSNRGIVRAKSFHQNSQDQS